MMQIVTKACFPIVLLCSAPAAAQFDAEGTRITDDLNQCVQKYALEKDDGVKSPATIADETMAACETKSIALESYAVRHSVKMTDEVRGELRAVNHQQAIDMVALYRKAGRVHAPN